MAKTVPTALPAVGRMVSPPTGRSSGIMAPCRGLVYRIGVRLRGLDRGRNWEGLLVRSVNGEGTSRTMGDEWRSNRAMGSSMFSVGRDMVLFLVVGLSIRVLDG